MKAEWAYKVDDTMNGDVMYVAFYFVFLLLLRNDILVVLYRHKMHLLNISLMWIHLPIERS